MFLSSETLTALISLGAPPEKLAEVLRMIERDAETVAPRRSTGAERTARYRERRTSRGVTDRHEASPTVTVTKTPSPSPSPPDPPYPAPIREEIYTPARGASDFDAFWQAYPAKVGKKAALKAWDRAKDRPPLDDVLTAIDRYRRAKPPDRDWCHPSTWLNEGRWDDDAPDPIPRTGTRNDRSTTDNRADARSVWADIIADRDSAGAGAPEPRRLAG